MTENTPFRTQTNTATDCLVSLKDGRSDLFANRLSFWEICFRLCALFSLYLPYCHRLSVRLHSISCMCVCALCIRIRCMRCTMRFSIGVFESYLFTFVNIILFMARALSLLTLFSFVYSMNVNDNYFQYMNPTIHFSPQTKCLILFDNVETWDRVLYLSAPFDIHILLAWIQLCLFKCIFI